MAQTSLNEAALFASLLNSNGNSSVYKQVIHKTARDIE